MSDLENVDRDASREILTLKWGTLKGYANIKTPTSEKLLRAYYDSPVAMGVMQQNDTDEQKKILVELITGFQGTIRNDWSGEHLTPQEAIDYVTNYGKEKSSLPTIK